MNVGGCAQHKVLGLIIVPVLFAGVHDHHCNDTEMCPCRYVRRACRCSLPDTRIGNNAQARRPREMTILELRGNSTTVSTYSHYDRLPIP